MESELTQVTLSDSEAEHAMGDGGDDDDNHLEEDNGNTGLSGLAEADLQELMEREVSFYRFAIPLI